MEGNSSSSSNPTPGKGHAVTGHVTFMTEVENPHQPNPSKMGGILTLTPTTRIQRKHERKEEEDEEYDDDEEELNGGSALGPLLKKGYVEGGEGPSSIACGGGGDQPSSSNVPPRTMANNQSKLERKDSSGDLHSRLKSRKTLGLGENFGNGEIPRSKTEQMLGYDEHLHMKLPKGYWSWQTFVAALLGIQGIFILIAPQKASELGLLGVDLADNPLASQYYAASIIALAFLLWQVLYIKDKGVARAALLAIIIHFLLLCIVDIVYALRNGISHLYDVKGLTMMGVRGGTLLVCVFFLHRIGTPTSGIRKSASTRKNKEDNNQNIGTTSNRRD